MFSKQKLNYKTNYKPLLRLIEDFKSKSFEFLSSNGLKISNNFSSEFNALFIHCIIYVTIKENKKLKIFRKESKNKEIEIISLFHLIKQEDRLIKFALIEYHHILLKKIFLFLEKNIKGKYALTNNLLGFVFEHLVIKGNKNKSGSYYTPVYISDSLSLYLIENYLINKTNDRFNSNYQSIDKILDSDKEIVISFVFHLLMEIKIIDSSSGSGNFLLSTIKVLEIFLKKALRLVFKSESLLGNNDNSLFETKKNINSFYIIFNQIIPNSIYGIDINKDVLKFCRIRMLLLLLECTETSDDIDFTNYSDLKTNLFHEDALLNFSKLNIENKFNIVIGNPPFSAKVSNKDKGELKKIFQTVGGIDRLKGNPNTAVAFTELSGKLLQNNGLAGLILPKSLLYINSWQSLRHHLITDLNLHYIVDLNKSFDNVLLEQIIIIFSKEDYLKKRRNYIEVEKYDNYSKKFIKYHVHLQYFSYLRFLTSLNSEYENIHRKVILTTDPLGNYVESHRGLVISKYINKLNECLDQTLVMCLRGKDIQQYYIRSQSFAPHENISQQKYFEFGTIIIQRIIAHIQKPRPHILLTATLNPGLITVDTIVNIYNKHKIEYSSKILLLLLNSELVSWYAYHFIYIEAIRSMDVFGFYLNSIPIPKLFSKYKNNETIQLLIEYIIFSETFINLSPNKRNKISFNNILLRIADCIAYCLYFQLEHQLIEILNVLDQELSYKFDFNEWYKNKQFLGVNNWNVDIKMIQIKIENLNSQDHIKGLIHDIYSVNDIKMIHSEFIDLES